jgi:ABC-type glycerol-3-phosphate transport system permease component
VGCGECHCKEAFARWTINPNELSESTYYIEESAGRVESVVPNIGNSLIIITGSVGISLIVGIWAAYALSRFNFRGSESMGIWILSTRMMPPIVIAIPLFCILLTWTEFLFASVFTNSRSATLPVVLSWFRQNRGILWGQMSAVMVVSLLPLMIITMILQKRMIKGLTAGAFK